MPENKKEFRRYDIILSTNGGFIFEKGEIYKHYCYCGGYYWSWQKDESIIESIKRQFGFLTANGALIKVERIQTKGD